MSRVLLSEAERVFVTHGVQDNHRCDGRRRHQYRSIELETGVIGHAAGSARLRLAHTDVLAVVTAEVATPARTAPLQGTIDFFVDCSATASAQLEGRQGDVLASSIKRCLSRAYSSPGIIELSQLCLVAGKQCWQLNVDILIVECGGNLYDAVSCCVLAALYNTRVPAVDVVVNDGDNVDLQLADDPFKVVPLQLPHAPCLVTLQLIGGECVVDPTPEEEACSKAALVVAVTADGAVTAICKAGRGSFHGNTIISALDMAVKIGVELNKGIRAKLAAEEAIENRQVRGFLG